MVDLFKVLDISVSFNSGEVARQIEKSRTFEGRLRRYFRMASPWRPSFKYGKHEDLNSWFDFGFAFGCEFTEARRAFTLPYTIYSSIVGIGVGDRDRMARYLGRYSKKNPFPPAQMSNYLHTHSALKKIHRT